MSSHYIFVYGSLKRGFGNHHVIESFGEEHFTPMGVFETASDQFVMRSLGGFPVIYPDSTREAGTITGELYEVSSKILIDMDILEGHPFFYKRTKIRLKDFHSEVSTYITVDLNYMNSPLVPKVNGSFAWKPDN